MLGLCHLVLIGVPYPLAAMASSTGPPPVCLGVLDSDTGFVRVLVNRLDAAGWQHKVLAGPIPTEALAAMRLK